MLIIFLIIIFGMLTVEKFIDITDRRNRKNRRETFSKNSIQKKWRYYSRI